jgi:hypothetical protein
VRGGYIAAGVVAFLVISGLVSRTLAGWSAARNDVIDAIEAQPRAGQGVKILRVDGLPRVALKSRTDNARIAWKARGRLSVVQCVRVRRTGNPVVSYDTRVLGVSKPIGREADC